MQVFKAFLKITKRHLGSILIYFIIFFTIFEIINLSQGPNGTINFSAKKEDIAILDHDHSEYSKDLVSYLGGLQNVKEVKDDKESLQNELYYRNISYILIIPEGYGKQVVAGDFSKELLQNVKIPNSISGIYIDNQIDHYLSTLKTYLSSGYDMDSAFRMTKDALAQTTETTIASQKKTNDASDGLLYFFQYYTYIILCMIISGLGPILLSFNNKSVRARMNASALTLKRRNFSLIGSSCIFAFACWLIFVITAAFMYPEPLASTLGLLCIVNSLLYLMISISLTFLISAFAKSINFFSIMANIFGLGMSFLCGVFVPMEVISGNILKFSRILPTYWYMSAHNHFTDYINSGTGLSTILFDYGIEVAFFAILLGLGFLATKVKRTHA